MSNATTAPIAVPENEIKRGMKILFMVQIFGTLSYSIIMTSLTLFTSGVLHFTTAETLGITVE